MDCWFWKFSLQLNTLILNLNGSFAWLIFAFLSLRYCLGFKLSTVILSNWECYFSIYWGDQLIQLFVTFWTFFVTYSLIWFLSCHLLGPIFCFISFNLKYHTFWITTEKPCREGLASSCWGPAWTAHPVTGVSSK